ncbi:type IV pilus assembly protein PilM [Candidatus Parcubacteria bacterium]|jgi:type IV pilus assembly protein PilM|nr:MAG: type IV pilus assembly protein PilM [Candidatus Parcubacteria bacterium]
MKFLRPFQNAIGIDVSDQVIRMAQLLPKNKKFKLHSISARPVAEGAIVDGEIRDSKIVVEVLKDLVKKPSLKHPSTKAAILCLPERKTFTKIIEVPRSNELNFEMNLREGLAEHIPLNLDEAYIDWQLIDPPDSQGKTIRVLVSVAPQLLIESYLTMSKAAGLTPIILETESAAISRFALSGRSKAGSHMIVDLGATRTGIVITESDFVAYSSTLNLSGNELTSLLQLKLNLNVAEAEQAKKICGLDPRRGKGVVKQILEPELKPLVQKIMEIISFYEEHSPKELSVQDITLVGGGAKLSHLTDLIQSIIDLPVSLGTWPANVILPDKKLQDLGPSFATSIGLALRGASNLPWFTDKNL